MFFLTDLVRPITVEVPTLPGNSSETAVRTGLENQFAPGLRVGVRLTRHLSAEAGFHFAATELSLDPEIGTPVGFDAELWTFGAGGRYRFLPAAVVSPYLAAGAGARRLDEALTADTETDLMWNVGAGAIFETDWAADVRVEVRDYMSEFRDDGAEESRLQHDLWAGVGLEFGVW